MTHPVLKAKGATGSLRSRSHVLRLMAQLVALGVIRRDRFAWVDFSHAADCKTLRTNLSCDCRCDCTAIFGGKTYRFEEHVKQAESV